MVEKVAVGVHPKNIKKNQRNVILDILFCEITTFIKVFVAFIFCLYMLSLIDFTKIYELKGLKPKDKGHINFYENCDLTKKYI